MKNTLSIRFLLSSAILAWALMSDSLPSSRAQDGAALVSTVPASAPAASTLPPDIDPNSPLAQVVSLAQAGVEQSVILNYINNSTGLFNLNADQIIYLNDLGVPSEIINDMMQRDQQLEQAGAAPPPTQPVAATETTAQPAEVTVNYFYDTLAPYGGWVYVGGDYGWCWRPTIVVYNPGWQPYCDNGHWVYTDCGWYWVSGYSWGWAAFHYGRWFHHPRYGWCWWPDITWAPSWVCWRYNTDYCGWAPLPPHAVYRPGVGLVYNGRAVTVGFQFNLGVNVFTFVQMRDFCDRDVWRHRVEAKDAEHIYARTENVHQFDFDQHNQTIINPGVPPRDITTVTKKEIHPVAIHYAAGGTVPGHRHEQFEQGGRALVVNRPHFVGSPVLSVHPGTAPTTGNRPNKFQPAVHGNGNNNLPPRPLAPTQNNNQHFNYQPPNTQPEPPRVLPSNPNNNAPAAPRGNYSLQPAPKLPPPANDSNNGNLSPRTRQFYQQSPHGPFQRVPQGNDSQVSAPGAGHYSPPVEPRQNQNRGSVPQNESRNNAEKFNHSQSPPQHGAGSQPSNHPSSSSSQPSGGQGQGNNQNGH
jgi:hypothetical protein